MNLILLIIYFLYFLPLLIRNHLLTLRTMTLAARIFLSYSVRLFSALNSPLWTLIFILLYSMYALNTLWIFLAATHYLNLVTLAFQRGTGSIGIGVGGFACIYCMSNSIDSRSDTECDCFCKTMFTGSGRFSLLRRLILERRSLDLLDRFL
jgi:hypothetical protein